MQGDHQLWPSAAPVLGAAYALGVALAARQGVAEGWDDARLDAEIERIAAARPTCVNSCAARSGGRCGLYSGIGSLAVEAAALEVLRVHRRGQATRSAGCGVRLPHRGLRGRAAPRTHALQHGQPGLPGLGHRAFFSGVIRALHADGMLSHVIVDDTRPLLQGARLTVWELGQLGIEHRLPATARPRS